MIVGTGVDIAEVDRIRESIDRFGERFLHRVFTDGEIEYCDRKAGRFESYAARFAAVRARMSSWPTVESDDCGCLLDHLSQNAEKSEHITHRQR